MLRKRIFGLCLLSVVPAWADPVLPAIFGDHMVLQRGGEIPVWGWADPGESITVSMAGSNREVVAGADRRWTVRLPAAEAALRG